MKQKLLLVLALLFSIAACQSVPPRSTLSAAQIQALLAEGFVQSAEGWEFSASEKLLFGSDEATLVPEARLAVSRISRLLVDLAVPGVRVDGHTDSTGSDAHNEQLSRRRAQAVADVMVVAGMPALRVQVRALAARFPIASNQTAEGRSQNRRVVLVIVSD